MRLHCTKRLDDKYVDNLYLVTVKWDDQRQSKSADIDHKNYAIHADNFEEARASILDNKKELNPGSKFEFMEIVEITRETQVLNPDKLYK